MAGLLECCLLLVKCPLFHFKSEMDFSTFNLSQAFNSDDPFHVTKMYIIIENTIQHFSNLFILLHTCLPLLQHVTVFFLSNSICWEIISILFSYSGVWNKKIRKIYGKTCENDKFSFFSFYFLERLFVGENTSWSECINEISHLTFSFPSK